MDSDDGIADNTSDEGATLTRSRKVTMKTAGLLSQIRNLKRRAFEARVLLLQILTVLLLEFVPEKPIKASRDRLVSAVAFWVQPCKESRKANLHPCLLAAS